MNVHINKREIGGILNIKEGTRLRNIIDHHYRRIDRRERETITTASLYIDIPRSNPDPYRVSLFLAVTSNGDRFVLAISRNRRRLTPAAAIARKLIAIVPDLRCEQTQSGERFSLVIQWKSFANNGCGTEKSRLSISVINVEKSTAIGRSIW